MNAVSENPVVVGVDGSTGSLRAIQFGAQEARRLGAGLTLVHVVPNNSAMPADPIVAMPPIDLSEIGQAILTDATAQANAAAPDLTVEAELRHGGRRRELVEASREAPLLVVGRDSRAALERLLFGNTVVGVAGRAGCPVVVVPPSWDSTAREDIVVVGVKSPSHARELMADAFAVASERGARLVVLHAWKLASGYDDIVADRVSMQDWSQRSTRELEAILTEWRQAYPDVEVETRVEHEYAAIALERTSRHADLLIIVRRAHGISAAMHLGGTARAILRTAACPVRVVPPGVAVVTAALGREHTTGAP